MSKEINNREYRKKVIKDLLHKLHKGQTVDEVKQEFDDAFSGVSAAEISEAEQALITEGVPVSEVQRLCDVHAAVFKGSIEEIHAAPTDPSQSPGHPAHTLKEENRAVERLIAERVRPAMQAFADGSQPADELLEAITALQQIDRHYLRKENLLFPYMEKYGITAPPKVMWGVDDEIRGLVKEAAALASSGDRAVSEKLTEALTRIEEMIFKEENILLPMLQETLTLQEWKSIADESSDLGYCLIDEPPVWQPGEADAPQAPAKPEGNAVSLSTGFLTPKELTHLLNALPMDITFVGKDDTVRYFSQGAERVFPRTRAIIGRKVANCHPPASVHIVEGIVADLKSGKKSHEDFWIKMGDKYILIRYFAVRDENGEFLGVLEVTQDIAPIQQITGEKRLVSD